MGCSGTEAQSHRDAKRRPRLELRAQHEPPRQVAEEQAIPVNHHRAARLREPVGDEQPLVVERGVAEGHAYRRLRRRLVERRNRPFHVPMPRGYTVARECGGKRGDEGREGKGEIDGAVGTEGVWWR